MKQQSKNWLATMLFVHITAMLQAQQPIVTESGSHCTTPPDGTYQRNIHQGKRILEYDYVHEKDVFWEKRIWQVVDLGERRNHIFSYVNEPFINVLLHHAQYGDITLYSTFDDEFTVPLDARQVHELSGETDTILTYDPETFQEIVQVVYSPFDPQTVRQYRIKEVWFFDEETSRMRVRILGVAPVRDIYDNNGNFIARAPMFWAYYPELRPFLAQHEAFNELNESARMTWDDIFEMRLFSSTIIKESNVFDRRIQDYAAGMDALWEAEKIKEGIRNFEHDLWEP